MKDNNDYRESSSNNHSGQFWAHKAEEGGASVSECGRGFRASTDKGTVDFPDRELRPIESKSLRHIFKLLGILVILVALWWAMGGL